MNVLMTQALLVYIQIRDIIHLICEKALSNHPEYIAFARPQLYYYGERCQALNMLLEDGKLWDCEILFRSALECATRFIFVSITDEEERSLRINEYSVCLCEIDDLHRSEKAKIAVDANDSEGDIAMLIGGVILTEEREAELRATWTSAKRNALKKKWSFSEMVRQISEYCRNGVDLRLYPTYLHSYALSSHLIHADRSAMNYCWDRAMREPEERELQISAHSARLLADQVSVLFLCWRTLAQAVNVDFPSENVLRELMAFHDAANKHQSAFADSQRHKYK